MPASTVDSRTPPSDKDGILKRRGLLVAAVAFVAGLVAKVSERTVEAGADGDVVLGSPNVESTVTSISNPSSNPGATALELDALAANGVGLMASAGQFGVWGIHSGGLQGAGVVGSGAGPDAPGVWGTNDTGVAVRGDSHIGNGLFGQSYYGVPILGQVEPGSNGNTIAIYGVNSSTYDGGSPGAGGFGIYGLCAKGHGLVGATATPGGSAVVGAVNGVVGALAGAFYGPVAVSGSLTVFGAKSAAVPHPDGSHRRLYCMESPESWFEDFGTGRLECGRAEVTIDPDFCAITDLTDYHVFLTERDTHQHLIVKDRTTTGFAVEADSKIAALTGKKETDLSGAFSWRVVAKRKDIAGPRLETVSIPPEPTLPPVPDLSAPTPPDLTRFRQR